MVTTTLDNTALKNIFKEALLELLQEEPDVFSGLFTEILEDIAFGKAIEEGEKTEIASEEEVFSILENMG